MGLIYSYYDPYYYYPYPTYYDPYLYMYGVYAYPRGYYILDKPSQVELKRYSVREASDRIVQEMPEDDLEALEKALIKSRKADQEVLRRIEAIKKRRIKENLELLDEFDEEGI